MGFGVSKPWGDSDRYDFVVDAGGRLWRVQVKSAYRSTKEGGYTVHAFGNENRDPYTAADVDVLVAYLVPEDAWCVVPIAAFKRIQVDEVVSGESQTAIRNTRVYREAWAAFMDRGKERIRIKSCGCEGVFGWQREIAEKRPFPSGPSRILDGTYGSGLENLFSGTALARCAVRWEVLHRRPDQRRLLPAHLPRANSAGTQRALLPYCCRRRGSWVSSVSQMSSRMLARHACMDGNVQHGLACFAFD